MVVSESTVADVVFVIEATANISSYVEAIKNNYILPTLEHFTGGPPDDRDIGFDNNYNCSMFALVPYVTFNSAPDVASTCLGPTSSSHKLLHLFDRVPFTGGGAEGLSHVTEGIATALQCFDDLKSMRDSVASSVKPRVKNHCILICNSPPYDIPSAESVSYNGMVLDELAHVMGEKGISLSIFAPRKMSFLFKIFEKAGGDLQVALSKKYAKDPRHLILLNGFQLQERPASPVHASSVGQKRSHSPSPTRPSPATHPSPTAAQNSIPSSIPSSISSAIRGPAPLPPPFPRPAAPTDVKPVRGASPAPQRPAWSSGTPSPVPVPSPQPPPPSALAMQLANQRNAPPPPPTAPTPPSSIPTSIPPPQMPTPPTIPPVVTSGAPRATGINRNAINPTRPPNAMMTAPVLTPRMIPPSQMNHPQPTGIPAGGPNVGMMNPQMVNAQMSNPQMVNVQMTNAHMMNPQMSNPQMSNPQMSNPQMSNPQMSNPQMSNPGQQQMAAGQSIPMMSVGQPVMPGETTTSGGGGVMPQAAKRTIVWSGQLDYQDKMSPPATGQGIKYQLPCSISSNVIHGSPEVTTEDWPKVLTLQLLHRALISKLTPIFKNSSIHVGLHFANNDSLPFECQQGIQKLTTAMSQQSVGCIQFQSQMTKIMIVIYMNDKKVFVGFIPRDQEAFLNMMRETVQQHKKPQPGPQGKGKQQPPGPNVPMMTPAMNRMPMNQAGPQGMGVMAPQTMGPNQAGPSGPFFQQGQQGQTMTMSNQMAPGQGPQIGPQQASNMLLNQALGPMTATQIRGQQQLSQQMGQPMAGQQQLSQQMAGSPQMMQQQQMGQQGGGPMGMQPTRVRAPMNVTMGTPQLPSQVGQQQLQSQVGQQQLQSQVGQQQLQSQVGQQQLQSQVGQQQQGGSFDRQQNSHTINQLEAMLAEAKRKEMTYQLQNPNQQGQMGPVQMVPQQQPMVSQQQPMVPQQQPMVPQQQPMVPQQAQGMGQQPPIRQQLQAHLQSAQHQRMAMNQPQMQQTPTGVTANPQLKHLLQQQQVRSVGPGQQQQMQQSQMNMNQIRMQQQQMMQQSQMQPQQQQSQMQPQQQMRQQWDQMDFNQQ